MKLFDRVKTCVVAASLVAACGQAVYAQQTHSNASGSIKVVASTVPENGDVNPYGIVTVPRSTGSLVEGNLLISNFNNSANLQGTGTTIVQITPDGVVSLFAQIDAHKVPGP
jgi:hypothetical protein